MSDNRWKLPSIEELILLEGRRCALQFQHFLLSHHCHRLQRSFHASFCLSFFDASLHPLVNLCPKHSYLGDFVLNLFTVLSKAIKGNENNILNTLVMTIQQLYKLTPFHYHEYLKLAPTKASTTVL